MKTPVQITIDEYPGWETSTSPYRVQIGTSIFGPLTTDSAVSQVKYAMERFADDFDWRMSRR